MRYHLQVTINEIRFKPSIGKEWNMTKSSFGGQMDGFLLKNNVFVFG